MVATLEADLALLAAVQHTPEIEPPASISHVHCTSTSMADEQFGTLGHIVHGRLHSIQGCSVLLVGEAMYVVLDRSLRVTCWDTPTERTENGRKRP